MGIVKLKFQTPENDKCAQEGDNHLRQRSFSCNLDELEQPEMAVHVNPEYDSGNDEFAEVGCEPVALGDQLFDVPYDLYDLLDLKSILSLNTWNTCLTEEEKFSLSAYLPDMDQETFWFTMTELLTGEEIFFGSPLAIFFQRLIGGFYSMRTSCFREGLQVLEKHKYYHALRSYQENMVQVFMGMERTWSACPPNVSVEERVCIWKKQKDSKTVFVVDLNAFPEDEDLYGKNEDIYGAQSMKRTRFPDNKEAIHHSTPVAVNTMVLPPSLMKPKGVLKIKSAKTTTAQNNVAQALPIMSQGAFRPTPKGVLKVKPRNITGGIEERPIAVQMQSELASSVELSGMRASSRLSPMIHSTSKGEVGNFYDDSHILHPKVRDNNYSSSVLPMYLTKQRGELVSQVTAATGCPETTVPGKYPPSTKYFRRASELCSSSTVADQFVLGHCNERSLTTPLTSSAASRISSISNDESVTFAKSFDLELRHPDLTGERLTSPSERAISEVQPNGIAFPITYKRKKAYLRQNSSHLKQTMGGSYESRVPQAAVHPVAKKTKPVKIKFKIWNDWQTPQSNVS